MGFDVLSGGSFYCDPMGWVNDDSIPVTNPNVFIFGKPGRGKSALVNRLVPDAFRATGDVSKIGKGRHTSSSVVLFDLPDGGTVIDTPGIRSFGLAHVTADDVLAAFDELAEAVHQVAGGGTVLDPLVVEALLEQPRSAATLSRLTPREREVLSELATGFSNRTVAQRLVLSQRAVEKHINSIFAKLELTPDDSVDRRVKAVLMFLGDEGSG